MSLNLKRLSLTNARLEILTRTETDLQAQFLELTKLREQFRRTAQLSADLQSQQRITARSFFKPQMRERYRTLSH